MNDRYMVCATHSKLNVYARNQNPSTSTLNDTNNNLIHTLSLCDSNNITREELPHSNLFGADVSLNDDMLTYYTRKSSNTIIINRCDLTTLITKFDIFLSCDQPIKRIFIRNR
jgi:hypothetical protein